MNDIVSQKSVKLACFGGIYSNYLALEQAILDAKSKSVDEIFCLGDLGAFGPFPDRVFPLLRDHHVHCMQGNYDNSIGNDLNDCQCGYTDPRDNYFAKISYDYTFKNTSITNRHWMKELPTEFRFSVNGTKLFFVHGSPRKMNEFLWESTSPDHFLEYLADKHDADLILATHTGIKWQRKIREGTKEFVNVGVLGRPENDGNTNVWYTLIEISPEGNWEIEFVPVHYDHERLADEMRAEGLPEEFCQTILTGYWTTCLEILPAKERLAGVF